MQPQVRLILPIFNRPWLVFVNLNSQVFFVPWPTSPKSQTVFSKEILGKSLSVAEDDCCMPIDNKRTRLANVSVETNIFLFISRPDSIVMVIKRCSAGYRVDLPYSTP